MLREADEANIDWSPDPDDPNSSHVSSIMRRLGSGPVHVIGMINRPGGINTIGYDEFRIVQTDEFADLLRAERAIGDYLHRVKTSEPAFNWRYCYDNGAIVAEIWDKNQDNLEKRLQYREGEGFVDPFHPHLTHLTESDKEKEENIDWSPDPEAEPIQPMDELDFELGKLGFHPTESANPKRKTWMCKQDYDVFFLTRIRANLWHFNRSLRYTPTGPWHSFPTVRFGRDYLEKLRAMPEFRHIKESENIDWSPDPEAEPIKAMDRLDFELEKIGFKRMENKEYPSYPTWECIHPANNFGTAYRFVIHRGKPLGKANWHLAQYLRHKHDKKWWKLKESTFMDSTPEGNVDALVKTLKSTYPHVIHVSEAKDKTDWSPDPEAEPIRMTGSIKHLNVPDSFVDAYIETALWLSHTEDGTALQDTDADLSEKTANQMRADCQDFWETNWELISEHPDWAGHDFWLTRNRHGAGFWDRPDIWGEKGAKHLTEMSRPYGSFHLHVGDDGEIHGN